MSTKNSETQNTKTNQPALDRGTCSCCLRPNQKNVLALPLPITVAGFDFDLKISVIPESNPDRVLERICPDCFFEMVREGVE